MGIIDWFKKEEDMFPKDPRLNIKFIHKTPEDKFYFIGKDGKSYESSEALFEADKAWMREHYKYKAMDGSMHSDWRDVEEANRRWMREHYKYKAMDGSTHSDWKDVEEANRIYMETMYATAKAKEFEILNLKK